MNWMKPLGKALIPIIGAVLFAILLLLLAGANPFRALGLLVEGSLGSASSISDTLTAWVTMVLCAAGLVVTFRAGLWNIGVEGQVIFGSIAAAFVARSVEGPVAVMIILTMLAGIAGGAFWALLAGVLRVYGKVNEIFGGLGLTFVATSLTTYLIIGPWKRPGVASTGGTEPFPQDAWLPTIGTLRISIVALVVAALAVVVVYFMMRGTRFGLRLKAVGQNLRSAVLFGIPNKRYLLLAFVIGGALAGLAGTIRVTGFHHKLVPTPSGAHGYLGILIVLLAGFEAKWIAPIAFFFAAIAVGASQLPLQMQVDSSLGGILRGVVVLFVLLYGGWQARRAGNRTAVDSAAPGIPAVPGGEG
jgi:general nucleoside transport system permease protein